VYKAAIEAGEVVMAKVKKGFWFDAGSLDDFLAASKILMSYLPKLQHQPLLLSLFRRFWRNFEKRPSVWEGTDCQHALNLSKSQNILLGDGCVIDPSVHIKGFAVLGSNTVVEKDVILENVVVGPGHVVSGGRILKNTLVI